MPAAVAPTAPPQPSSEESLADLRLGAGSELRLLRRFDGHAYEGVREKEREEVEKKEHGRDRAKRSDERGGECEESKRMPPSVPLFAESFGDSSILRA